MKKKVYITLFIIVILVVFRSCIVIAASGNENIETTTNIDSENNIIFNIQVNDIKSFEGILDYDSEVIEYVGIESLNNWNIRLDSETIVGISEKSDNSGKNEVAKIKFKIKETGSILTTSISMYDLKIIKEGYTVEEHKDIYSEADISSILISDEQSEVTDTFDIEPENVDYSLVNYGGDVVNEVETNTITGQNESDNEVSLNENNANYSETAYVENNQLDENNEMDENIEVQGTDTQYSEADGQEVNFKFDEDSNIQDLIEDEEDKKEEIKEKETKNNILKIVAISILIIFIIVTTIFTIIIIYKKRNNKESK